MIASDSIAAATRSLSLSCLQTVNKIDSARKMKNSPTYALLVRSSSLPSETNELGIEEEGFSDDG